MRTLSSSARARIAASSSDVMRRCWPTGSGSTGRLGVDKVLDHDLHRSHKDRERRRVHRVVPVDVAPLVDRRQEVRVVGPVEPAGARVVALVPVGLAGGTAAGDPVPGLPPATSRCSCRARRATTIRRTPGTRSSPWLCRCPAADPAGRQARGGDSPVLLDRGREEYRGEQLASHPQPDEPVRPATRRRRSRGV